MTSSIEQEDGAATELYRRVRITAGARFNASRRLEVHSALGRWSIGLASCVLLVIPLFQALGVSVTWSEARLSAVQVILAAIVLVASLILGSRRDEVRALEMHDSARKLNALERRLHPSRCGNLTMDDIEQYDRRYTELLECASNHETIDFEKHRLYRRDEYYVGSSWEYVRHWLVYFVSLFLEYGVYLILLLGQMWILLSVIGAIS
ncbi:MAG: SLATT domain-containing protein [Gemmatimonadales bacterium]|nr:SLATT domain-containing protein [Gemmatimonadales bacterium]MDZ4388342.1 SLATT domain-containing protein [Gemmatimonadales bacterium]